MSDSNAQDHAASTNEVETIVRSYFASFATGDPDAVAAHVSGDFVNEHTATLGTGSEGRAAYRDRLPGFLSDMVDLRYEVEHLIASGPDVAVFYVMTARWQGATPIEIRGAQRLRVDQGAITRRVDYWDSKVFLDQVGSGD